MSDGLRRMFFVPGLTVALLSVTSNIASWVSIVFQNLRDTSASAACDALGPSVVAAKNSPAIIKNRDEVNMAFSKMIATSRRDEKASGSWADREMASAINLSGAG